MFTGVFYKPHNSESDVAQIPRTNTTHGAVGTITHTHTHTHPTSMAWWVRLELTRALGW